MENKATPSQTTQFDKELKELIIKHFEPSSNLTVSITIQYREGELLYEFYKKLSGNYIFNN